jgi:hypothetical protein
MDISKSIVAPSEVVSPKYQQYISNLGLGSLQIRPSEYDFGKAVKDCLT